MSDTVIGSIDFSMNVLLKPWEADPSSYYQEITGKISVITEDSEEPEAAGEIKLILVKLAEAQEDGVFVGHICDSYSMELDAVHSTLFHDGDFKDELEIDGSGDLLFIDEFSLSHRDCYLVAQIIETVSAAFASPGVVVAYKSILDFGMNQWKPLGFREVPKTDLVVRDNFNVGPNRKAR